MAQNSYYPGTPCISFQVQHKGGVEILSEGINSFFHNSWFKDSRGSRWPGDLKFIYSEQGTNFCEISTFDLSHVVTVKSTEEILQNLVAFSEYMNFTTLVWIQMHIILDKRNYIWFCAMFRDLEQSFRLFFQSQIRMWPFLA